MSACARCTQRGLGRAAAGAAAAWAAVASVCRSLRLQVSGRQHATAVADRGDGEAGQRQLGSSDFNASRPVVSLIMPSRVSNTVSFANTSSTATRRAAPCTASSRYLVVERQALHVRRRRQIQAGQRCRRAVPRPVPKARPRIARPRWLCWPPCPPYFPLSTLCRVGSAAGLDGGYGGRRSESEAGRGWKTMTAGGSGSRFRGRRTAGQIGGGRRGEMSGGSTSESADRESGRRRKRDRLGRQKARGA